MTMKSIAKKMDIPFSTFKRRAIKLGVYITNQGRRGIGRTKEEIESKRIPLRFILDNTHKMGSNHLKKRLFDEGVKNEICEDCGIGNSWNSKKLNLHLDHIDGDKLNNRIDNLRILCPNCHSQTDTYAGKNIKLKNKQRGYEYSYVKKFDNLTEYWYTKKENWTKEQERYVDVVMNSSIDFSKFGWVTKLSTLIKQKPQKVKFWMERIMPEFYEKCYKRAGTKN